MKQFLPIPFGILLAVIACSSDTTEQQDLGLKPPSELALLMRDMTTYADSTRSLLMRGGAPLPFPKDHARMHTATATDDHLDRATFTAFADNYLAQLKVFNEAAPEDRKRTFNAVINACASCHNNVCPGPMVRIKKLYVPL
ncbi:MAG: hypothetical protein JNM31_01095 [Flavobacteriales bacterium]|nr:hypothetical protein [Flavobacteriales bacterium]